MRNDPYPLQQEARLRDYFATLKRRWVLFVGTFLIVMVLAVLYTLQIDKVYRSQISILVQGRNQQFMSSPSQFDPLNNVSLTPTVDDIPSQIEVLQGFDVLRDSMLAIGKQPPLPSPDLIQDPLVSVQQASMTNVLVVSVDSRNQTLAYQLAQQIPVTYASYEREALQKALSDAIRFAQTRENTAKAKLDSAMSALQKFRASTNITQIDDDTNYALRDYADAKDTYSQAQQKEVDAQSSLNSLEATLAATPAQIQDKSNQNNEQYVLEQRSKLADLEGQLAQAKVLYRSNNPKVQQLQNQVNVQRKFVDQLPQVINTGRLIRNPLLDVLHEKIAGAKSEYEGAASAATVALQKMNSAKDRVDFITSHKGTYDNLNQKVIDAQNGLQISQKTLLDLEQRQSEAQPPVQEVGAVTPPKQIKPNWPIYMAASFVFAIAVGLGVVGIKERLDDRVYTVENARAIAGSRNLGAVPLPNSARSLVVAGDANQAENFRLLRSNLLFTVGGEPMRSIAVVSGRNNEGRSEIASNLAASMALGSHDVVLIDANLRRPSLHKVMNLAEGPGLTDVILGYKTAREVLQETDVEGLKVITAGSEAGSSTELLASEAFTVLLDDLKEQFHFIIVDTSAALASADAQVAADACDGSVFVIKVGVTHKTSIRYCMEMLKRTRTNILGVIYNRPGKAKGPTSVAYEEYEDEVA